MTNPALTAPTITLPRGTARKIILRLLPLVGILYFVSVIDRVALGFAAVHGMNDELGLTATTFGFASGIFFLGYILVEVPSNALLVRFGSRKWITRIMISWGIVQILTAFAPTPELLYLGRFLLGVAEAGFAPGILYFLATWFPAQRLGRINAIFFAVGISANIFGSFIGNGLVALNGAIGWELSGWRFLILGTGVLALLAAVATFVFLTERPADAKWLRADQRSSWQALVDRSAPDLVEGHTAATYRAALKSKWTWLLGLTYFALPYGGYALIFFLPLMVQNLSTTYDLNLDPFALAAVTAIPYVVAIAASFVLAVIADRTQAQGRVIAIAMLIAVVGIVLNVFSTHPIVTMIGLCLLAIGATAPTATVFAIVPKFASGAGRAASLAVAISLGTTGGFFGPYVTGFLTDTLGSASSFWAMAIVLVMGAIVAVLLDGALNRKIARESAPVVVEVDPAS